MKARKVKMKRIVLVLSLIVSSFSFSSPAAQADDQCTSANPCGTWAVVDSSGVVRNIIVCEERVCGASGDWHGVMPNDTPWPGARIVLQVPPNPVTNQSQGGNMGTPDNPVKYDSQERVFTQGSASTPAPVTRSETVDTTTISATINSEVVTFGPNSFINGQMQVTPRVNSSTRATISATQTNYETRTVTSATGVVTTEIVATTESESFTSPQTREQIALAVQNKYLLERRLERIYILLRGWLID
jgi:hypothetical protein